jgi:hypothetical protein
LGRTVAIGLRYYVFETDGGMAYVPHRVVEGLHLGTDAVQKYSSSRQRVAEVVIENEAGKPVRIIDVQGRYWSFDAEGKLEKREGPMWFSLRNTGEKARGKVVDLRPQIERNQWKARNLWDVTKEELDRVVAALRPDLATEPAAVQSVKGKAPKRPPLTSQAHRAMGEIGAKLSMVGSQLSDLSEPGLKGIAFEARQRARMYKDDSLLWTAVADEADRLGEIKARHRTGKGTWFAVLQVWLANEDSSEMRELETIEERCDGKAAAIDAARRLLAQHAGKFSDTISVEPAIYCDLEWEPSSESGSDTSS